MSVRVLLIEKYSKTLVTWLTIKHSRWKAMGVKIPDSEHWAC